MSERRDICSNSANFKPLYLGHSWTWIGQIRSRCAPTLRDCAQPNRAGRNAVVVVPPQFSGEFGGHVNGHSGPAPEQSDHGGSSGHAGYGTSRYENEPLPEGISRKTGF
jgi:hypothetical protein